VVERVAHYDLLREVDYQRRGSVWVAHAAEGAEAGRLVMLRRQSGVPSDTSSIAELRMVAAIAKRIRDPKVVAVLDVVFAERELLLVSEYIEGEPLISLQRLGSQRGQTVPLAIALRIGLDLLGGVARITEALRAISQRSAVGTPPAHGSVSPDCILVATFGEAMLTDLGVAGLGNCLPRCAEAMRYWAPERFDHSAPVDEQADVFSVGVVLWELIANQRLFGRALDEPARGNAVDRIRRDICILPIPRLDAAPRGGAAIPRKVSSLIARALGRDRGDRFQTADEMIRSILQLETAIATPEDVVSWLDGLARPILQARREALGHLSHRVNARASAPEKGDEGTYRPPASAGSVAPVVPRPPKMPLSLLAAEDTVGSDVDASPGPGDHRATAAPPEPPAPPLAAESERQTNGGLWSLPRAQPAVAAPAPLAAPTPSDGPLAEADSLHLSNAPRGVDADARGPFGWAPQDSEQPPEDARGPSFLGKGRILGLRAALLGGGFLAVVLVLVVAIGGTRRQADSGARSAEPDQGAPRSTPVSSAPTNPGTPATPPVEPEPIPAAAEPTVPPVPTPSSAPRDGRGAPPPEGEATPSPPRSSPGAGEKPRPGSDGQKFRPRGI
jgi:serine/threonine-protein kinase